MPGGKRRSEFGRTEAESETIADFDDYYRSATSPTLLSIERSVCGCDYGGSSWTTRAEADRLAEELDLSPSTHLLEVGAGAGWPALYLAKKSGCSSVLVEPAPEALQLADARIRSDGLSGRCRAVRGGGTALPVGDGSVDAVAHSDVLCCLPDKVETLRECRRAIRQTGRMAFTVIYVPPGLSSADHAEGKAAGPPFVESDNTYESMLTDTGWRQISRIDLTLEFAATVRRLIEARLSHSEQLCEQFGAAEHGEFIAELRRKVAAAERGLLRRAMFVVAPEAPR